MSKPDTTKRTVESYRQFLIENECGDLNKAEVALCINILEWTKDHNEPPTLPPVDNEHVEEGCQRFGLNLDAQGKPILGVVQ